MMFRRNDVPTSFSEWHYVYNLELGRRPSRAVRLRTEVNDGLLANSIFPLRSEFLPETA